MECFLVIYKRCVQSGWTMQIYIIDDVEHAYMIAAAVFFLEASLFPTFNAKFF